MSSLTRVTLSANTWVNVSAEMVASTRYRLILTGSKWARFAEFATTPTDTTSYAVRDAEDHIDFIYESVPIHVYAAADNCSLNIMTLAS